MNTKTLRSMATGAVAALALAACSASSSTNDVQGRAMETESHAAPVQSSATSAYEFFVATRASGGYRVAALNGATFACGSTSAVSSCEVSTVDLSALDLPSDDVAQIVSQIGRDATAPTLLFAGAVADGSLAVQEVWRAPEALPLDGTLLFYSSDLPAGLVVDQWSPQTVGTLDFSGAPEATYCDDADGGLSCGPSYVPVETDVASPAGILLLGSTHAGVTRVSQYFLEVTVGKDQDGDGYSYCQTGQTICASGKCSSNGICLYWGGRGLIKIYTRSANPTFDQWLVATGQESASAAVAPADGASTGTTAQASTVAGVGASCLTDSTCGGKLVCEPICPIIPNLEHCMTMGGTCEAACTRSASSLSGRTFTSADGAHSIVFTSSTTFTKTDGCPDTGIHCMHEQQTEGTFASNGTTLSLDPTSGSRDSLTVESHCYEGLLDKANGVELWPTSGN